MKAIGSMKNGLAMNVTRIAPSMFRLICVASRMAFGKYSSVAPISLEKRFRMRPAELVSKKRIAVDISPLNMLSCSFCDEATQMR